MLIINTNAFQYMFGARIYGYVGGEKIGYIIFIS